MEPATPPPRLVVEGGDVVVSDGRALGLMPGAAVVVDGDTITHVGAAPEPRPGERRVDARGLLVLPGMVNLETCTYLDTQGFATDHGHPNYFGPSGFNFAPRLDQLGRPVAYATEEDARAIAYYGFMQAVQGGATTIVGADYGDVHPEYADLLVEAAHALGVRAYLAPAYGAATHYVTEGGGGDYHFDRAKGQAGLARGVAFGARTAAYRAAHPDADVHAMLFPYRADAMDEALLRETKAAAADHGLRVRMHAAQFLMEFYEQVRRTAETPIEFLARIGFLGEDVLIHHAILTAEHSWIPKSDGRDVALLAETGTSVGHCPTIFARRAVVLESFQRMLDAGVNVGLGTDTVPQDMLEVMRWTSYLCKVVESNVNTARAADVLKAATLHGARALGRDDLGRIAPGAKGNLVLVDVDQLRAGPLEDPLRNLLIAATSADIHAVYVGGVERVRDGRVVGVDEGRVMEVVDRLFEAKRQALATGTARHRFPPSLQVWPGPTEPPHAG
jgi:5-methylthioadenosine/S-adenosylhomocysteine deaminase